MELPLFSFSLFTVLCYLFFGYIAHSRYKNQEYYSVIGGALDINRRICHSKVTFFRGGTFEGKRKFCDKIRIFAGFGWLRDWTRKHLAVSVDGR
jgi:hypothetical protein